MNIALLSSSQNSYSETFIQAHRNLNGNVFFFYQGEIPKRVEGIKENRFASLILRSYFRIKNKIFGGEHSFDKFQLKRNLRRLKIEVGLAEYGTTGAYCFEVFKELNIPLVVHFHGYDASLKRVVHKFEDRYKLMFAYAASIIAVSREMRADLVALGADPYKVYINPYGPADIFLAGRYMPAELRAFLHVGRFTEKKAPINTIKAFAICLKEHPSVKLLMVGDGALLDDCKSLVKALEIEKSVHFLGKKSPQEVLEIMEQAYAFVLHSVQSKDGDKEGTPVSILEAMAVGLPVVSTKHAGIRDVVLHNKTGYLVEEHDIDGMASYMIDLIERPEEAREIGRRGKERILENYTINQHLGKINELLKKATNK